MANENEWKRETLADIADEIRRAVESMGDEMPYTVSAGTMRRVADRIKAAWRRERAEAEANALAVGGIVEAARHKPGNAAAMREALRTLRQRFDNNVMAYQDRYFKFSGWHWHKKAAEAARWRDVFHELREACDAALYAPARNCEIYKSQDDAWFAYKTERLGMVYFDLPSYVAFVDWLFAISGKGGAE